MNCSSFLLRRKNHTWLAAELWGILFWLCFCSIWLFFVFIAESFSIMTAESTMMSPIDRKSFEQLFWSDVSIAHESDDINILSAIDPDMLFPSEQIMLLLHMQYQCFFFNKTCDKHFYSSWKNCACTNKNLLNIKSSLYFYFSTL